MMPWVPGAGVRDLQQHNLPLSGDGQRFAVLYLPPTMTTREVDRLCSVMRALAFDEAGEDE